MVFVFSQVGEPQCCSSSSGRWICGLRRSLRVEGNESLGAATVKFDALWQRFIPHVEHSPLISGKWVFASDTQAALCAPGGISFCFILSVFTSVHHTRDKILKRRQRHLKVEKFHGLLSGESSAPRFVLAACSHLVPVSDGGGTRRPASSPALASCPLLSVTPHNHIHTAEITSAALWKGSGRRLDEPNGRRTVRVTVTRPERSVPEIARFSSSGSTFVRPASGRQCCPTLQVHQLLCVILLFICIESPFPNPKISSSACCLGRKPIRSQTVTKLQILPPDSAANRPKYADICHSYLRSVTPC